MTKELSMLDRRREPRFSTEQPAELVLLEQGDLRLPVKILDLSGSGARLLAERKLPIGSAVRVDVNNCMLLGEVCYCEATPEGYLCGVKLEQALTNVSDLLRLMSKLMGEEAAFPARSENRHSTLQ